MLFFERDIAIDLGTISTRIYVSGRGVKLREATTVAIDRNSGKLLRMGDDAKKMMGRTPANIVLIHPIASGVISDYDMTSYLLKSFISRVTSFSLFKPRVLILVPGSISGVEERAIIDAAIEGGARKVYLMESSVATAIGAGVDVKKADGRMVIDIGGGTTEIAVISLNGVAQAQSIKTAGTSFDEAIVKYIRTRRGLHIGMQTAEELKMSIGCVKPRPEVLYEKIRGRSTLNGLPTDVTVSSTDLAEAMAEPAGQILEAVHYVLEHTEPELVADLSSDRVIMTGGASQIYGMAELIAESIGIKTEVEGEPLNTNIHGAGRILNDLNFMQDGMINLARRRQMKK